MDQKTIFHRTVMERMRKISSMRLLGTCEELVCKTRFHKKLIKAVHRLLTVNMDSKTYHNPRLTNQDKEPSLELKKPPAKQDKQKILRSHLVLNVFHSTRAL